MADGAVIVGVAAVLTSGVLGPLVVHQAQKDRDDRDDVRAVIDAAAEALAVVRSHDAWLEAFAFESTTANDLVRSRIVEMLERGHAVEAQALKLELRFPGSELAGAYQAAGLALGSKAGVALRHWYGITPTRASYEQERESEENEYRVAYELFVRRAAQAVADL